MVLDHSVAAATLGTAMNVHVFAEHIVGTDGQTRVFPLELKILWLQADRSKREKPIILANRSWPLDNHVRFKPAPVADRNTIADTTVRTDKHIGTDLRFRTDNGGWMNHKGGFRIADFGFRICVVA